jgi:hypothetical protein
MISMKIKSERKIEPLRDGLFDHVFCDVVEFVNRFAVDEDSGEISEDFAAHA